jgi:GTP-binding protein
MFVDRVFVKFIAGKGGNGIVSWKREKYIPKGGPGGGDGGTGGSVVLVSDSQVPSLEALRNRRIIKADDGADGGRNSSRGKNAKNITIKVPCGTLVKDKKTGEVIHDFVEDGDKFVLCRGGRGGFGNEHFKTPTNQAPNICTPGRKGIEKEVELELKLIADVGLVGFPNAGKSTFMSEVTHVPVKVAAYPFTTLRPNLGYIHFGQGHRVLLADIPGIIAGASENRGLGLEFLRHIERTKLLIFILDASGIDGRNPTEDFTVLLGELKAYDPELLNRPHLVVLNKMDCDDSKDNADDFYRTYPLDDKTLFEISALTGEGVGELLEAIHEKLQAN